MGKVVDISGVRQRTPSRSSPSVATPVAPHVVRSLVRARVFATRLLVHSLPPYVKTVSLPSLLRRTFAAATMEPASRAERFFRHPHSLNFFLHSISEASKLCTSFITFSVSLSVMSSSMYSCCNLGRSFSQFNCPYLDRRFLDSGESSREGDEWLMSALLSPQGCDAFHSPLTECRNLKLIWVLVL
ncbi:hypothetical protein B0H67DRAFT_580729 [Lasiosphaeris hirsuta]|uniref:Uncharacterized protein n=1 Tax=Lasiosphaeris hirsuta TaxID=260670 RepID=A0AA40AGJ6_9PEZI|nr:hypothetical protein B0H67DRAFT_580729 [Lasiosphaeris hirsuta]